MSKNGDTLRHVERLIDYLQEHDSVSRNEVVRSGMMNAQDAQTAIRYCIRHRVISHEVVHDAPLHERVRYYLTGILLRPSQQRDYSFDALLRAWGLAITPPEHFDGRRRLVVVHV
ncbi:hypothetical protein WT83_29945 [Burkholderia territorii]|uniref:Winged helix-turn-helix domain-containing protein n=2 Tax=Burkholderia territorii TaxID=1503055 RepID=A0A108E5Q6_9BURK|nr:hypothetical protein WT83_29945 [Burkholderia territorii]